MLFSQAPERIMAFLIHLPQARFLTGTEGNCTYLSIDGFARHGKWLVSYERPSLTKAPV